MVEKELKILEIDTQSVEKKLLELWAMKHFEGIIHDVYYDFPHAKWEKLGRSSRLFRLRNKWGEHMYTIKKKRNSKTRKKKLQIKYEAEHPIQNTSSFIRVLEKYGMKKTREKVKFRISYLLWELEFDIDRYDGIPDLLEIEAMKKKDIMNYIEILGLQKNPTLRGGSRKLFEYYGVPYIYFD